MDCLESEWKGSAVNVRRRNTSIAQAVWYQGLDNLTDVFRFLSDIYGTAISMTINSKDFSLNIVYSDNVMGDYDEWTIKPQQYLVFDSGLLKVMSDQRFEEQYEKIT